MNCQFCFAPIEEENIKQKSCSKCKANFFLIEKKGLDLVGEAIRDFDSKIFNFSLKPLEAQLDKSIKAEDLLGFQLTLCPFCSTPLFLKNLCDASNDEKGIALKFLQKEKKEIRCPWCGKVNMQIKGSASTENIFLPFKIKSEFEKNLERFLEQPPIPNIEERKGCLSFIFLFPFFK